MEKLSEEQQRLVYDKTDQNYLLRAGAGSGKTFTLLCRVLYMIASGIPPESIMVATFTVQAARDIENRLTEMLGPSTVCTVGTLDSIARRFLFARYGQETDKFNVSEYCKQFLQLMLTEPQIICQYKYFIIDEFQDLNNDQFELISQFKRLGGYITAVGDEQQNIYSFRGGSDEFMHLFHKKSIPRTHELYTNFRSTPQIVSFGNQARPLDGFQMRPWVAENGSKPALVHFDTIAKQNEEIVAYVKKLIECNVERHKIAILSTTNHALYAIEEALTRESIPNVLLERVDQVQRSRLHDHVCLCTIHKSKGLEWDIVFLIGAEDRKLPFKTDPSSLEEARRLFYVAVTRAKRTLSICFAGKTAPTRFITEIAPQYYQSKVLSPIKPTDIRYTRPQSLDAILQSLTAEDYEFIREQGFLPTKDSINVLTLYGKQMLNQTIHSEYLYKDFEYFVRLFIMRSLSRWLNIPDSDPVVILVLKNHELYRKEYLKWKPYFKNMNLKLNLRVPAVFQRKIEKGHKAYLNKTLATTDILDELWDLACCYPVVKLQRLRVLYKELTGTTLFKSHKGIFTGIMEKFIKSVIKEEDVSLRFVCKHPTLEFLNSECDFVTKDTLYHISISNQDTLSTDLILRLLIQHTLIPRSINYIKVFNPLVGIVHQIDVQEWRKEKALIAFIHRKYSASKKSRN